MQGRKTTLPLLVYTLRKEKVIEEKRGEKQKDKFQKGVTRKKRNLELELAVLGKRERGEGET